MKYLHFSIFLDHKKRHGGVKRSDQIASYLKAASGVSSNPYLPLREAIFFCLKHPGAFAKSVIFALNLFLAHGLSTIGLVKISLQSAKLIHLVDSCTFDVLVLETAPGLSLHFMRYLAERNVPYIAMPHNVEFLVPHQHDKTFSNSGHLFAAETYGYKRAMKVITICDFDRSVLRCTGASASTLPYFPTENEENIFLEIRNRRSQNKASHTFLLLGTVENGPTYEGVKLFLDKQIQSDSTLKVVVAGHGTEKFAKYGNANITILGSVSDDCLKALLLDVSAILINQPQTSGFLTKIVEMNLCGIPQIILSDYQQSAGLEEFGVFRGMESFNDQTLDMQFNRFFEKPSVDGFLGILL